MGHGRIQTPRLGCWKGAGWQHVGSKLRIPLDGPMHLLHAGRHGQAHWPARHHGYTSEATAAKFISKCDDPDTCQEPESDAGPAPGPDGTSGYGGTFEYTTAEDLQVASKTVCMVTDWYDQYGNYIDTTVDSCWKEAA